MKKKEADKSKDKSIDMLLDNSIALQKITSNLASELKELNQRIKKLLEIFESASASFKESGASKKIPKDYEDKLDTIIEQNKTIAEGLLLIEKGVRKKKDSSESPMKPSINKKLKAFEEENEEDEIDYKSQPLPEFSF